MDIFGLTPIDAALSVLGLNYCHLITAFLFHQTSVAVCVFVSAFLLSVWQVVRSGRYRPLMMFFFLGLSVVLLLLPYKEEGIIKSTVEHYGQITQSSHAFKDQITNTHRIPSVLTFLVQATDAISLGVIHAIDAASPDWAHYLTAPFSLHRHSFHIREALDEGIKDVTLSEQLNKFLYDHYLPALSMLRHDAHSMDSKDVWPGDKGIAAYYSPSAQKQWGQITNSLKTYLDQDVDFGSKGRTDIGLMTQTSDDVIQEELIKSIVRKELRNMAVIVTPSLPWQISSWILAAFPYVYGWCNVILYVTVPFLILAFIVTRHVGILMSYSKIFLWVKSWMLGGALCFYSSLLLARVQSQSSVDPSWAWEHPYYGMAAAMMLVLMPVLTFLLINKMEVV